MARQLKPPASKKKHDATHIAATCRASLGCLGCSLELSGHYAGPLVHFITIGTLTFDTINDRIALQTGIKRRTHAR